MGESLKRATDQMIDALSPEAPKRGRITIKHKPTEQGYDPEKDMGEEETQGEGEDEEQEQPPAPEIKKDKDGDPILPKVTPLQEQDETKEVKVNPAKINLDPIDLNAIDPNDRGGYLENQDIPTPKLRNQEFRKRGMRDQPNKIGKRGMRSRASVTMAEEYQGYFENKLDKWNIAAPSQLPVDARVEFFAEVDRDWDVSGKGKIQSSVVLSTIRANLQKHGLHLIPSNGILILANPEEWTIDHYIDAIQHHLDTVKKEFAAEGDTPKLRTSIDSLCRLCDAMRDGTSGGAFVPEDLDTDGDDNDEDDPGIEGDDGEQEEEEEGDEEDDEKGGDDAEDVDDTDEDSQDDGTQLDDDDIVQDGPAEEEEDEEEMPKKKKKFGK